MAHLTVDKVRRDSNDMLFNRRTELQTALAATESSTKGTRSTRHRVRTHQLARQLDDVTREIVDSNQGLVRSYVRRFTSNASMDDARDFHDAGVLGLMHAIATYQVGKGTFAQWAYKRIQCEVLKAVRSADHPTISAGDFERRPAILKASRTLADGDDNYVPNYREIAEAAQATVEQVRRVLEAPRLDSLTAPIGRDNEGATLGDTLPDAGVDVSGEVLGKIDMQTLEVYGLSCLDSRELFVIARRYGLDTEPMQHLSAIGEILGLSREAVRQIEAKALAKMQHPIVLRQLVRNGRTSTQRVSA
jgi:RNA polymerase sigma factor (sigma-70 family)